MLKKTERNKKLIQKIDTKKISFREAGRLFGISAPTAHTIYYREKFGVHRKYTKKTL